MWRVEERASGCDLCAGRYTCYTHTHTLSLPFFSSSPVSTAQSYKHKHTQTCTRAVFCSSALDATRANADALAPSFRFFSPKHVRLAFFPFLHFTNNSLSQIPIGWKLWRTSSRLCFLILATEYTRNQTKRLRSTDFYFFSIYWKYIYWF